MDVIGDLVGRDRRRKAPLIYAAASQPYTAHKFCTDAWKAANLFRYHGVGPGREVAIADEPTPQALLGLFGAGLLGASVRFGDPGDARLMLGPAETITELETPPGTKRVAYGGQVDDPAVIQFERASWSENPTMPPDRVDPESAVLVTDGSAYSHTGLLDATERVVADSGLTAEDAVAVRSSLTEPGTIVAGVLAPLSVAATIVLPGAEKTGTVAVTDGAAPEGRTVRPASLI